MAKLTFNKLTINAIVFDFDGVLTDNRVTVDQSGNESVRCHRGDGLAFDALRKLDVPVFIVSTEKNPVVKARADKLQVRCIQGVGNKLETIKLIAEDLNQSLTSFCYVGNDLNDYHAMQACGMQVCPKDSHEKITQLAHLVLETRGGEGVARELVETHFDLDLLTLLYS